MLWSRAAQALAPRVGIWPATSSVESDFSAVFGKANRFYLNQLEADLDVSLPSHTGCSGEGEQFLL